MSSSTPWSQSKQLSSPAQLVITSLTLADLLAGGGSDTQHRENERRPWWSSG